MGCVQAKSSTYSPHQGIEKMKLDGGYIKGDSGGIPITHKQLGKVQASKELTRLIQSGDLSLKDKHIVRVESGSGGGAGGEAERERSGGSRNVSKRAVRKKIGEDELVDGWPKWLVDNVSADLLEGLVPKSADSYDKLAKVSVDVAIVTVLPGLSTIFFIYYVYVSFWILSPIVLEPCATIMIVKVVIDFDITRSFLLLGYERNSCIIFTILSN
jgi:hypothetical protein